MKRSNSKQTHISPRLALIGVGAAALFALVQACSSDGGNASPSDIPTVHNGGSGGAAGTGGSSSGGSSHGGETAQGGTKSQGGSSAGGTSGAAGEAGAGPTPVTCDPTSTGKDGCFKCPDTDIKFLNQCTASHCAPFDNTKLGLHGATLPPLPG